MKNHKNLTDIVKTTNLSRSIVNQILQDKHQRKKRYFSEGAFYYRCRLVISLTACSKYILCQVCLIFCCSNCLMRLVIYLSKYSMRECGINFSGNFIMMVNIISSSLLCSLWKKSFALLHFLISISIIITP